MFQFSESFIWGHKTEQQLAFVRPKLHVLTVLQNNTGPLSFFTANALLTSA